MSDLIKCWTFLSLIFCGFHSALPLFICFPSVLWGFWSLNVKRALWGCKMHVSSSINQDYHLIASQTRLDSLVNLLTAGFPWERRSGCWPVWKHQEGFDELRSACPERQASSPLRLASPADCATVPRSQDQAAVWLRVKPRAVCLRLADRISRSAVCLDALDGLSVALWTITAGLVANRHVRAIFSMHGFYMKTRIVFPAWLYLHYWSKVWDN